jgi:hypothetical protein
MVIQLLASRRWTLAHWCDFIIMPVDEVSHLPALPAAKRRALQATGRSFAGGKRKRRKLARTQVSGRA